MDGSGDYIILSEVSHKDNYHMVSFICGIFKKWTYSQNRNRLREWIHGYQRVGQDLVTEQQKAKKKKKKGVTQEWACSLHIPKEIIKILVWKHRLLFRHVQLCNPIDCSKPGFPVHHHLPELAQTHVHWVSDAIQPSHPLSSPSLLAFNLSQHRGLFQWVSSSHQVAKVLELQLISLKWWEWMPYLIFLNVEF